MAKLTVHDSTIGRTLQCSCDGGDTCTPCRLYKNNGGPCEGCQAYSHDKDCTMVGCEQECDECPGTGYEADVPGVCCKSPHKDLWLDKCASWERQIEHAPRRKIALRAHGISVHQSHIRGGATGTPDDVCPAELDALAVNLPQVWSAKNGWHASDLKDYLRMRPDMKLILMSASFDNHLEKFSDKGFGEADIRKAGVDYIMPVAFSAYWGDAKMHKYVQFWRTQESMWNLGSDFIYHYDTGGFGGYFIEKTLDAAKKIPQMLINGQFLGRASDQAWHRFAVDLNKWDRALPENVSFWVIGPARYNLMAKFFATWPNREFYFLSTAPRWTAQHGHAFDEHTGKTTTAPALSKPELAKANQLNYVRLVEHTQERVKQLLSRKA